MREMKDSGIEWIGKIPLNWGIRKTKYVVSLYTGNSISDNEKDKYEDNTDAVPYIATKDIKQEFNIIDYDNGMYVKEKDESFCRAFPGSTLMCIEGGSAGRKKALVDRKVCFVNKLCCFAPTDIDAKYLYFILNSPHYEAEFNNNISGLIGGVSKAKLGEFYLPYADRDTQEKIGNYLDAKCAKIDSFIKKQQAIIEKLKEYKVSVITETVTKGITNKNNLKNSKIDWIEAIPEHWRECRVANLYKQTSENGNENLPFLTVSINSGISDRELEDDEQDRSFVRSEDRTKYKKVQPGDLVYNMMRAWQGAFGAARVEGMVSPAYVTCRPINVNTIDTRYIEYLFRTPIAIEEMHRYSHGVADFRLRLYWDEFKNIKLCLPPLSEQTAISDYLDSKVRSIEATISDREKIIEKMDEYRKSLIYEVVTGKKEV